MRTFIPTSLLLFLLFLPACELPKSQTPTPEDMTPSETFPALDRQVVWEVVLAELRRGGLELDPEQSVAASGEFETRWVEYLAPFRHEGIRKKLMGVIEEMPAPDTWRVRAITRVQRNADLKDPLDSKKAIWQDIESDATTTEEFLYRVRRHFVR